MMIKNKKQMLIVVFTFFIVVILGTFSYAFFNYTRTGVANRISVGRISFITRQSETINLVNVFPIERSDISNDNNNVDTLVIEIVGDTDYINGIEYLISTTDANVYSNGKIVPISIDMEIEGLGTNNDNYFTARNNKNATIYKRLSGDMIVGNQSLLVGYIKSNSVSGTIEGINGNITIKAYLDKDKIAISDTYGGRKSDLMGTTEEWVDERVVLKTDEWNSLQANGISFKVKVEANEGIWLDEPMYDKLRMNTIMDNINSTYVNNSNPGIDFAEKSSNTNGKGLYTRAGTEEDAYPIMYYRGNVDNNNVFFANKCWQMIRTTDTGGIKMIYNGENTGTANAPACENTEGESRKITLNVEETNISSFQYLGNNLYNSPAYVGYMYGTQYSVTNGDYATGSKFGNSVTWDGTAYTLIDVSDTLDANHHYTCGTSNALTCNNIRYYYTYFTNSANGTISKLYFTLTGGKTIEIALEEMNQNVNSSNAKVMIEKWFEENIDSVNEAQIEDTIYCNDRSIYQVGGLNPNGGTLGAIPPTVLFYASYKNNNSSMIKPNIKCLRKIDSFTKSNIIGNGNLNYPVGLITSDEIILAGGNSKGNNAEFYLNIGVNYWSMSPYYFSNVGYSFIAFLNRNGLHNCGNTKNEFGLRPVISLKHGTSIISGDGTISSPYVIKI